LTTGQFIIAAFGISFIIFTLVYSKLSIDKREWILESIGVYADKATDHQQGGYHISSFLCSKFSFLCEYISEMLVCPFCTGFWIGLITLLVTQGKLTAFPEYWWGSMLTSLALAMLGALIAFGGGRLVEWAEIKHLQDEMRSQYKERRMVVTEDESSDIRNIFERAGNRKTA
jgi:low affinity Fe/Cu permease